MRLTPVQWRHLIFWFARGATSEDIARETGLDRKRVLRALSVVRTKLASAFANGDRPAPHSRGDAGEDVAATPVIGIRFRRGHPTAEVIPGVDGRAIGQALRRPFPDLRGWEHDLRPYVALVVRHQLRHVSPVDPHPPHGHAELGAFWAYLRQELVSRGGIRRERLALYLAEYSWRYRWRRHTIEEIASALGALVNPSARVSPMGLWGDDGEKRTNGECGGQIRPPPV